MVGMPRSAPDGLVRPPRVLLLDAMGVIFEVGDDVNELLIPFLRERGCAIPEETIADLYTDASLGAVSAAAFWIQTLGPDIDPQELTRSYVGRHRLDAHLPLVAETAHRHGIRLVCASNDVSEWAVALREKHRLDDLFEHWIVSGDIGARKPDRPMFDAVLDHCGVSAAECLFVDDRIKNVEAATALGIPSALFSRADADRSLGRVPRDGPWRHLRRLDEVLHWLK